MGMRKFGSVAPLFSRVACAVKVPLTCFVVQVVILKINSSQSSSISFVYIATPNNKESFQLFKVIIAMFLEKGECYWCRDCRLVCVYDKNLRLWGSGLVLALN